MTCEICPAWCHDFISCGCLALHHQLLWFDAKHEYGCRSSKAQILKALAAWEKETPEKEKKKIRFINK